jgi:uncharacterized protein
MARPRKCRHVCCMPANQSFGPLERCAGERRVIVMTVDEFETIRLIDLEGLSQEECAEQMEVARTTAQAIYNSARVKLAECLVKGMELTISGGDYVLSEGKGCCCRACGYCHKRKCCSENEECKKEDSEK